MPDSAEDTQRTTIDFVVIGMLVGVNDDQASVVFADNQSETAIAARTMQRLTPQDIGAEVAISFENGDVRRPIVLGKILRPAPTVAEVEVDDRTEVVELAGTRQVTLRCGKASITLTREGKIILRGTYISSRSSGMNRIKGGSVQLN